MVVRVSGNGTLTDSKPCCMCINMMKKFGIYRVYYSDENGCISYQRVDQMQSDSEKSDTEINVDYFVRGLSRMKSSWANHIKMARLPMTKKQKTLLIAGNNYR